MRTFGHGWEGKFTQIAIGSGGGAIVKPSSPLGAMWPYLTVAKLTSLFFVWKIKQGKDTLTLRQFTCVVNPRLEVLLQSVFSVFMYDTVKILEFFLKGKLSIVWMYGGINTWLLAWFALLATAGSDFTSWTTSTEVYCTRGWMLGRENQTKLGILACFWNLKHSFISSCLHMFLLVP